MSLRLQIGSIILADVNEPGGQAAGPHPAVVVSRQEEIDAGIDFAVIVCSTSFSLPLPSGWFSLPTTPSPGGHPITGLSEACVAKATWPQIVPQNEVIKIYGRAPRAVCKQIINWLADENAKRLRKQSEHP